MSWGNRLVIVFVAFAALMGTLVYKAVNTRFELVSKDYYKDELRYQEKMDGATNAAAAGPVLVKIAGASIEIQLPASLAATTADADAWFYCKTNASHDQRFQVKIENGVHHFDTGRFAKDSYELKLQFTSGGKQYYYSSPVIIQ